MLRKIFYFFLWSWVSIGIAHFIFSINYPEAYIEFIILFSSIMSAINTVFVFLMAKLKISNFQQWPKLLLIIEPVGYFLLLILSEEIVSKIDFLKSKQFNFEIYLVFFYPLIFLLILFYLYERTTTFKNKAIDD